MQVLTNQEFTYRESPAEQDGYGKFKALYGNTLVWHQKAKPVTDLIPESGITTRGVTMTRAAGGYKVVGTVTATFNNGFSAADIEFRGGHKYYISGTPDSLVETCYYFYRVNNETAVRIKHNGIFEPTQDYTGGNLITYFVKDSVWNNEIVNQLFDLTEMFGAGNEPTEDEFKALFPLSFYDYTEQSYLLSFGGRNVKFNQLVQNGNFADSSLWGGQFADVSISNGVADVTLSAKGDYVALRRSSLESVTGHKYFVTATIKCTKKTAVGFYLNGQYAYTNGYDIRANTLTKVSTLINGGESGGFNIYVSRKNELEIGDVVQVSNVMLVDLTEMFGTGNEPSAEGFKELFPNDYYEYTTGKYMNIGQPVSLKTVGFNQWDEEWEVGAYNSADGNKADNVRDRIRNKNPIRIFPSVNYYVSKGLQFYYYDADMNFLSWNNYLNPTIITTPSNACYMNFNGLANSGTTYNNDICINISDPERNGTYESYKENIIEIPLDEFPDGMDGINDVRDYKNETGYAKRIGRVTLDGSESWYQGNPSQRFFYEGSITNFKDGSVGIATNGWEVVTNSTGITTGNNKIWFQIIGSTYRVNAYANTLGLANAQEFKTYLASNPITVSYELATPLENYGVVDLGSLTWSRETGTAQGRAYTRFRAKVPNIKSSVSGRSIEGILCSDSKYYLSTGDTDYTYWKNTTSEIFMYNMTFETADSFKQAMSGAHLLYEKETPTETVYPPQSKDEYPFFKSYKGGTEQLLPENGSVPVTAPILADMNYSSGAIEVTTYPNPEQGGETSGDGWYLVGEEATVNALPNEHYAFNNWVLDGEIVSTDPEYTFEVQDE